VYHSGASNDAASPIGPHSVMNACRFAHRDPAQRAPWMREYRRRKRAAKMSAPASRSFSPPIVRAPEPSRLPERIMERPIPQPGLPKIGFVKGRWLLIPSVRCNSAAVAGSRKTQRPLACCAFAPQRLPSLRRFAFVTYL
jgi:hypothetical protein